MMRTYLLSLHLLFAALWLGCVITEALFERALLPHGPKARQILANLHVRVDTVVEVPAIIGVLITGAMLWFQGSPVNPGFATMLVSGVVAIAANAYCVWLVFLRRHAAQRGDWSTFDALDHKQHKFGAIVLVGVLLALAAGIWGRGAV